MKQILFLAVMAVAILSACGGEKLTPNGYHYTKFTSGNGAKGNFGDVASVHVYVYHDDSLVYSSRNIGQDLLVLVRDFSTMSPEQKAIGKGNPLEDGVAVMQVGDSIAMDIPITEELRKRPELAKLKSIRYHIKMLDIKTEQEYQAEQEAIRKEMNQQNASGEGAAVNEKAKAAAAGKTAEVAATVAEVVKQYSSGKLKGKIKTTNSGLKYYVLQPGNGETIKSGMTVNVNYYGVLANGTMFDNSFQHGQPFPVEVGVGRVIKGWDEGLALLKKGDKAFLFIPPTLGYGEQGAGPIPPNSELIFYVEPQ